jgi:hypothetical protein
MEVSDRFTSRDKAPGTHWIGGRVGLSAGLDAVVKRKNLSPCRDLNPRSSIIQGETLRRGTPVQALTFLNRKNRKRISGFHHQHRLVVLV